LALAVRSVPGVLVASLGVLVTAAGSWLGGGLLGGWGLAWIVAIVLGLPREVVFAGDEACLVGGFGWSRSFGRSDLRLRIVTHLRTPLGPRRFVLGGTIVVGDVLVGSWWKRVLHSFRVDPDCMPNPRDFLDEVRAWQAARGEAP
jgi:hypothetical protein